MSAVRVVDEHLLAPVLVYSGSGGVFDNELQFDTQGGILREQIGSLLVVKNDFGVVAALTGSVFSGPVSFLSGATGSIQTLHDGSPFIRGATGINVTSGTDGSITIATSGSFLTLDTLTSASSVTFNGDVYIEGTLYGGSPLDVASDINALGAISALGGLTGSLTQLADGSPYLVAGAGISIVTGSQGQVTISATGTGGSERSQSTSLITELVLNETLSGPIDGANTEFSLAYTPATTSSVMLWMNGQLLNQGSDYTVTSQTVTMSFPPQAGDVLLSMYTRTAQTKLFAMNEAATKVVAGGAISLTLASEPSPASSLMLFLNGQLLTQGSDYTLSSRSVSVTNNFIQDSDVVLATYSYLS